MGCLSARQPADLNNESCGQDGLQHVVTGAFQKEPHQYFSPADEPEILIGRVIGRLRSQAYSGAPDALSMNIANT